MSTATLEVLSCGEGELKITFNPDDPIELERAKRMIQDMLKRGYALFVHSEGDKLVRIRRFDPEQKAYIVGSEAQQRAVPMGRSKVTAVGRSAGG